MMRIDTNRIDLSILIRVIRGQKIFSCSLRLSVSAVKYPLWHVRTQPAECAIFCPRTSENANT